jgi:glycolate oxidase FAD binding subunit
VLAEITFKVFPRPAATRTLRLDAPTLDDAVLILTAAASMRFEFDALDLPPGETGVLARLAAPAAALDALTGEVLARWPGAILSDDDAQRTWAELREFRWCAPTAPLVKIALAPAKVSPLGLAAHALTGARMHVSAGGNVAYVALADAAQAPTFDALLRQLALPGLTLRGTAPLWLGTHAQPAIADAVKAALDPVGRFPELYVPSVPLVK